MQDRLEVSYVSPLVGRDILVEMAGVRIERDERAARLHARADAGDEQAVAELEKATAEAEQRLAELQARLDATVEAEQWVVVFGVATKRQDIKRSAALLELRDWLRGHQRAAWQQEHRDSAEPTDEDLDDVPLPLEAIVEYNYRGWAASLHAAVIPEQCRNFEPPETASGWLDLPDELFDDARDAVLLLNPKWGPLLAMAPEEGPEKNAERLGLRASGNW